MIRRLLPCFLLALAAAAACSPADEPVPPSDSPGAEAAPSGAAPTVVTEADIPPDIHRDTWARLPLVRREDLDADGQRAFDVMVNPESRYASGLRSPPAMWIYSPLMAEHLFPMSTYLRFGTEKDQRLTELTILSTAREVRSQFEWTSHEPLALRAGLEPGIIDVVTRRVPLDEVGEVPGLGEHERAIIAFTREVLADEKVSAETFARTLELFGERGVMDLAGLIGYYRFVDVSLKAFDVQLAPGRDRSLPDLW